MSMSTVEKILSTPPVAVAGLTFMGVSLPDWASLLAIVYTLLLILAKLRKELWAWSDRRAVRAVQRDAGESE